ncbi:transposase, IS21 family [Methylomarinovum caldicuralii]|uniref:Transposase, IS21 family n=2 Tax=Methylomarinovum caldicuralii TaxID=438856 RepID=A0AAU9BZX9_9GAMM|nr:IS21 family transposase [Methylomarinovum caldicuralii]BCX81617.1 transposase, IS21 family [Methylomarinovum caldicuralii]
MKLPEEVAAVMSLHAKGWGSRRIAKELGMSRNTVRRYVRQGGWKPSAKPKRSCKLEGLEAFVEEQFRRHRGNAEVVRQELKRVHGVGVSLRTVERAVAGLRRSLEAEGRATVRFETPPGKQMQIDFGQCVVVIAGEKVRVHLFVATLGYSRRSFVMAFTHQRQSAWLAGIEAAFRHFGGVVEQLLLDNARALVDRHDPVTREVSFNERFHAFCRYWDVTPKACAPYRARTKGKCENGVGYVKRNAIAGREFGSFAELQAHLEHWMAAVADVRIHGTTGERPIDRFQAQARQALGSLKDRAPFQQIRELSRKVHADACVEADTNRYSVPWRLIGQQTQVQIETGQVKIYHGGVLVACHAEAVGKRQRRLDPAHLKGVISSPHPAPSPSVEPATSELLRPLAEYEQIAGGAW